MTARDRILNAVRRQTEDQPSRAPESVDARLAARTAHSVTPAMAQLDGRERIDRFVAQAEAVQTSVRRIARLEDVPTALAEELRQRNLGPSARMGDDPAFANLDWGAIEVSRGPGRIEEPAAVSRAFAGVAETGTLMLLSGADNPVTLTFLGETHFVIVDSADIEAGLEGAWSKLRASGRDSRTVNFVTGPSRTADIEQKLELGAHGPVALHVFLIDPEAG